MCTCLCVRVCAGHFFFTHRHATETPTWSGTPTTGHRIRHGARFEPLEPRTLFESAFANVNVSRSPGNHAEGSISVDPTNPLRLFAASNAPGTGLFASTSADGGVTWTGSTILDVDPAPGAGGLPAACCDPSAAFDRFG